MRRAVILLAVVVAALIGGCGGGIRAAGAAPVYTVVYSEMRFSPNSLQARAGEPITVRLVNDGAQQHDLLFPATTMPGLRGLETSLAPGQQTTIRLVFDEPGIYRFECAIEGHALAGMTGAVTVSR